MRGICFLSLIYIIYIVHIKKKKKTLQETNNLQESKEKINATNMAVYCHIIDTFLFIFAFCFLKVPLQCE